MASSFVGRGLRIAVLVVVAGMGWATPAAFAAQAMDTGTAYGTMVEQAARTLGGSPVACDGVLDANTPSTAQALCVRVPESMFGYFEMGVHGRLYEYLSRGTLRVARAWANAGGGLRVSYDVQGGTLTVERKRVGGRLYGIFLFQTRAGLASTSVPGGR